jgi:hypothetical protein
VLVTITKSVEIERAFTLVNVTSRQVYAITYSWRKFTLIIITVTALIWFLFKKLRSRSYYPLFVKPKCSLPVYKSLPLQDLILSHINPVYTTLSFSPLQCYPVNSLHSQLIVLFQEFIIKMHSSHAFCMCRPSILSLYDQRNNIC